MMTHLESSLWDDSDSYRLMNGITTITELAADNATKQADKKEKESIFKKLHHLLTVSAKQIILK